MNIKINHSTTYYYSDQVSLGIHKLYLSPQFQPFQKILDQKLSLDPEPAGIGIRVDLVGNFYTQVWFDKPTSKLQLNSQLLIDCLEINPFGFIIEPYFIADFQAVDFLGFYYRNESDSLIQPFIHREFDHGFRDFVTAIRFSAVSFLDFLVKLTAAIHQDWKHIIRKEEDFWAPEQTFRSKNGSCRDLAWMQMNMLGSLGLATRFVSGYAFNPELESGHELHAWLETYLPGAGWIGLDPSLGLLTNQLYIPLAFHADPSKTLPVQGTFAGDASSRLETAVEIFIQYP